MTLDQIWFRLCDKDVLKREVGKRTEKMESAGAMGSIKQNKDGMIRGRDKDGNVIRGKIRGKSLAKELTEREERKRRREKRTRRKGR